MQDVSSSTDSDGNTVVTTHTYYYFCKEQEYWEEFLVETFYSDGLCSSIPNGFTYTGSSNVWSYSSTTTVTDDSTGLTTETVITIEYDCSSQILSDDTIYYYTVDSCNAYQIPSAYTSYDENAFLYYYIVDNTNYDDTTGVSVLDVITNYYECDNRQYSNTEFYSAITDTCASVNLPSGYSFDSDNSIYYSVISSAVSYDDSTFAYTSTVVTSYYDCPSNTYTTETITQIYYNEEQSDASYPSGYSWDPFSGFYYTSSSASTTVDSTETDSTSYTFYDASYGLYLYTDIYI